MISGNVFKKGMQQIEQSCNQTMMKSARELWFSDLNDEGFNDEDFNKGVTDARRSCGRYFPTLASLIDSCRPYYVARIEKEGYAQKQKDDETSKRFFDGARHSKSSQAGTDLINGLFAGTITKPEAIAQMKKLDEQCPGKGWAEQAAELENAV